MKKATLLLLLTALFPVAACDMAEVDASELGHELREVLVELRDAAAEARDELIEAGEEARDELRRSYDELREELANDEELRRELEELQAEVQRWIEQAKAAGAEAWEATRDGRLDAVAELEKALEAAKRELR